MTESGMLRIGDVAARTEQTLRTLRHWDEVGLLRPSGRTVGGFRLYTEADVETVEVIRRMKPLGLSLDEMRSVLAQLAVLGDPDSPAPARRVARARLTEVRADATERRQALAARLALADELLDLLDEQTYDD